jgi:fibro-slime domain-containing protein
MRTMLLAIALAAGAAACGPSHGGDDTGDDDAGDDGQGGNGDGGDGDSLNQNCGQLTAIFRDFQSGIPSDFEGAIGDDRGLVETDLGVDGKPVYAPGGATATVSGQASFDEWYRDTAGVNMHFEQPLVLTETAPGTFVFDDQDFFPLDGLGFGNEGNPHNFHFTTEVHGTFRYQGGEVFTFTGDDDVFIFVNGKLALDLGGVHGPETASIDFDAQAAQLGITVGSVYTFDAFHAERHTTMSDFRIETSISCFVVP